MAAKDGEIGKCKDALFDDDKWTVRYLDIDTGNWLPGRRVLISPISLKEPHWQSKTIPTQLTVEDIENSPSLDSDAPVSKRWESVYYSYFNWPHYASGPYLWGYGTYPRELFKAKYRKETEQSIRDTHLRSCQEVIGYRIHAKDREFGAVEDFIVDTESWTIRYLVIDTVHWIPSKSTLVSPEWVLGVSWTDNTIDVNVTEEQIKEAPRYDETEAVNKQTETRLYDYYGRPKYWETDTYNELDNRM